MLEGRKWFHFIGIGGIGMSGLAYVLSCLGHKVTGSDHKESEVTRRLESQGIKIELKHSRGNIFREIDFIVVSSAIHNKNEELNEGCSFNIPIVHRGELLAQLLNPSKGIAVAGSHGKTTTTGMLAVVLEECGFSPTVLIGGDLPYFNGNAQKGAGEILVAEADESDGSFLKLNPQIGVITNIENDHLDYYITMQKVEEAFFNFIYRTSQRGIVVVCIDDDKINSMVANIQNKITYGFKNGDLTVENVKYRGLGAEADVYYEEKLLGKLVLNVPGKHNLLNALAVVGVGIYLGIEWAEIARGLARFTGVKRRFQIIGQVNELIVVDDYAHHPTEIKATLEAARAAAAENRVIAVFQPHRFTRTKTLCAQFAQSFAMADIVIFDEIYSAGEEPISGVSTGLIINLMNRESVFYCRSKEQILLKLKEVVKPGDLVITMGAGDIWQVAENFVQWSG